MYCFKDFPVRKLILHSQKCDGDMSGPRERFQSFVPSVHDVSRGGPMCTIVICCLRDEQSYNSGSTSCYCQFVFVFIGIT